jgi:hypothetical protein
MFRGNAPKRVLVITGGHPFDGPAFYSMLDQVIYDEQGLDWTHVENPAAYAFIEYSELAAGYDLYLFYDVPGQEYQASGPPVLFDPSIRYQQGLEMLLDRGKPMLFVHHAIVGWPKWPRYAEIVGGCLMSAPGVVRGKPAHGGGVRHDIQHTVYPVAAHPVTEGLDQGFELIDQLYLAEVFEDSVVPLMRSTYQFGPQNFDSVELAFKGIPNSNEGWTRPPGSNLVVWARREKLSPIVYMMDGDGRPAFENKGFRKLFGNAVSWLVSDDARRFGAGSIQNVRETVRTCED